MKRKLLLLLIFYFPIILYAQIGGRIQVLEREINVFPHGEFVELSFPNSVPMDEIGSPQLPYITKSYVLPQDAKVTGVRINSQNIK